MNYQVLSRSNGEPNPITLEMDLEILPSIYNIMSECLQRFKRNFIHFSEKDSEKYIRNAVKKKKKENSISMKFTCILTKKIYVQNYS